MKIGIDARLIDETGVGRYIRNLIRELGSIDKENTYIVYLTKSSYHKTEVPNERWVKRLANVRWHTLAEQFVLPFLYMADHLDVLHIPYYSIPIFYPKRFIVTIHDLTILHTTTGRASTLPYLIFWVKQLAYRLMLSIGIRRASHIIAVSETTKKEILDQYHIPQKNITVTYEGVDPLITNNKHQITNDKFIQNLEPYFLYVGNAYPHKNVELLVNSFADFLKKTKRKTHLLFVGKEDYFYIRLRQYVESKQLQNSVKFFGGASDTDLRVLYQHAHAFVFPSKNEGFGLPALEALYFRCPLIVSDIPVFRELLQNIPTYVKVNSQMDLTRALIMVSHVEKKMALKGKEDTIQQILSRYTWSKMVRKTLSLYRNR